MANPPNPFQDLADGIQNEPKLDEFELDLLLSGIEGDNPELADLPFLGRRLLRRRFRTAALLPPGVEHGDLGRKILLTAAFRRGRLRLVPHFDAANRVDALAELDLYPLRFHFHHTAGDLFARLVFGDELVCAGRL